VRFDLPDDRRVVHAMRIPIRWGDMDAMGHVNNTVYFRYFESVRIEYLHGVAPVPDPDGEGFVIVNAFCNFLKQLHYPGELVATLSVGAIGRKSFDTFVTLERTDEPGTFYATGGATTVWVDYKAGKAVELPGAVRAAVGGA
jgi:acyl-CoA thioester hydrolase